MTKTTSTVTREEASAQAKNLVRGILNEGRSGADAGDADRRAEPTARKLKLPPKPGPAPTVAKSAWIRYYENQQSIKSSPYGRGSAREFDYFERSLMCRYVDDCDRFFDLVDQNPETCAIIYPDPNGKIRMVHHLTTAVHGKPIVVGVDGIGSISEVKVINMVSFTEKVELGELDKKLLAPQHEAFMEHDLEDLKDDESESKEANEDRLETYLKACPSGYMIHPLWANLIQDQIGSDAAEVARTLSRNVRKAFDEKKAGFDEYETVGDYFEELRFLFVYLWACHRKVVSVRAKGLLKSFDSPNIHEQRRHGHPSLSPRSPSPRSHGDSMLRRPKEPAQDGTTDPPPHG